MSFSLVTYSSAGEPALGVLTPDGTVAAPPELKAWTSMADLFDHWADAADVLAALVLTDAPTASSDGLLTPLQWPRKVLCAGVNYRRHIREMGAEIPGDDWRPFFFMKPPTTTLIGPSDAIVIRHAEQARYDWEAELAVVIGIGGRDIPVAEAMSHVAGYAVANDVTARGHHRRTNVPADAFVYDWFASKSIDTSLPLGPGITPAFLVPDPHDLRMRLWVNDELQQDESTGDMICRIDELIATASSVVTLEPGDIISTGTPSGTGVSRGLFLKHGDVVRVDIEGLGQITNRVIDAERSEA